MKVLLIGRTQFIGRHIAETLLKCGDEVTLFHRGNTNGELFPAAEHRCGDRDQDLAKLARRIWDAAIDTSAYLARHVKSLANALGGSGGRYVFISLVSAYATPSEPNFNEDSPLEVLEDPLTERVTADSYGGLRALCTRAVQEFLAGNSLLCEAGPTPRNVWLTYLTGRYHHGARFTWGEVRIAHGAKVLEPESRNNPVRIIDVRTMRHSWFCWHVARRAAFPTPWVPSDPHLSVIF